MTLQTLNNIRELAQQLRVGSVRRRRCPGRPVSGRAAITSAPAHHPAHGAGPNDYADGRGIPWQERASADRCHGRAGHQLISAAGNDPHRIHKNRSSGQEQHTRSEERWRK